MIPYKNDNEHKNLVGHFLHTQDGHGGRADEHRAEMEEIARRVCAEECAKLEARMHQIAYEGYSQAIKDFLHAIEYDVESVTRIGFDGCRDIFEDKKAQKFISDHIMKEIQKQLNGKHFRK